MRGCYWRRLANQKQSVVAVPTRGPARTFKAHAPAQEEHAGLSTGEDLPTGYFFGEGCLTGQPRRLATVRAMSDLEVMRFDNTAIQRVLHEEPDFSEFFISYLLACNGG
jgi:CRP-like cAMP-binding protein